MLAYGELRLDLEPSSSALLPERLLSFLIALLQSLKSQLFFFKLPVLAICGLFSIQSLIENEELPIRGASGASLWHSLIRPQPVVSVEQSADCQPGLIILFTNSHVVKSHSRKPISKLTGSVLTSEFKYLYSSHITESITMIKPTKSHMEESLRAEPEVPPCARNPRGKGRGGKGKTTNASTSKRANTSRRTPLAIYEPGL
ncbi:hypothetical protein FNV43_RR24661 [Rhamnella rubrinervis]|uniref:Uncharacterized protein n=1 Tax=Rhamnella rubrinervis TaxID=2594499 RepID=A0A8K0DSP6_9ROSA|nr:hypothetical protein FNV43_RR24661 [Rhamnella rubrinervis]